MNKSHHPHRDAYKFPTRLVYLWQTVIVKLITPSRYNRISKVNLRICVGEIISDFP